MAPGQQQSKKAYRRHVAIVTLIFATLILSAAAATGTIGTLERTIFDWAYSMPDSLRWFALIVTQLGNFWLILAVVGLLFVVKWNPKPGLLVLRNGLLTYLVVLALKFIVGRPRPVLLLGEVTSREVAVAGNGFPSAHIALATVISLTILPYLPRKLRWLPVPWIGLVAWSRLYLGVHAPLDVIGGFMVGALMVLAADVIPWPPVAKKTSKRS